MKIKLSPIVSHQTKQAPVISLSGLVLTIDNNQIDLSVIPVGGQAEAEDNSLLLGTVTRDEVTIKYPYSTDIYESKQSINEEDYVFNITEGTINCPLVRRS
jgi:hypothetical protein